MIRALIASGHRIDISTFQSSAWHIFSSEQEVRVLGYNLVEDVEDSTDVSVGVD
jgi:hypothetical protein